MHDEISTVRISPPTKKPCLPAHSIFLSFNRVTLVEAVAKFFSKAHLITCPLDPVLSQLLWSPSSSILHFLTHIFNPSNGVFPNPLKHAQVTPMFKKPINLNNLRTISFLPFTSKLLDWLVYHLLSYHFTNNNLPVPFQCRFCPKHTTETALLKHFNSILTAKTNGHYYVLLLLDLSAVFTVDHPLFHKKFNSLGLYDSALGPSLTYLMAPSVSQLNRLHSSSFLCHGPPKVLFLWTLLFFIYTSSLGQLIYHYHFYAEDTQIYLSTPQFTPTVCF